MSYASMAAKNAPPEEEQVQPSQALLDGHFKGETEASGVLHDGEGVNVVTPDWKDHPVTDTSAHLNTHAPSPVSIPHHAPGAEEPHVSEVAPVPERKPYHGPGEHGLPEGSVKVGPNADEIKDGVRKGEAKAKEVGREAKEAGQDAAAKAKEVGRDAKAKASELGQEAKKTAQDAEAAAEREGRKLKKDAKELAGKAEDEAKRLGKEAKKEFREAENAAAQYLEKAKEVLLRPGVMGGLLGVVNLGIIGGLSYVAYTRKELRADRRLVSAGVAGTLALFGAEGIFAERYINTPEGREEAERAKREGSKVWMQTKETVLRPGVAGGLVGAVNVAVLGAVGYFSYKHWDLPRWDRQVVGGVAAGLAALTVAEGYLGKEYKEKELPRQKRKGKY